MLFEYAVEPDALGSSWETFRYVIEKFGFDRGRLISEFPRKKWFKAVYEATVGLPPIQKKRVEVALNQARVTKVVRCDRPYDATAPDWLRAALIEHQRQPFRAIIARANPAGAADVLLTDDLDDFDPLMAVAQDAAVPRDAASIAEALKQFLRFGSRVSFVDPFYDPYNAQYRRTLKACLSIVQDLNPTALCEMHYRYHPDKPDPADLERAAIHLFSGEVPEGVDFRIYCWREKPGGEDFHDRFLLTDRGGMGLGAGFSAEGAHQTTNMHLMSFETSQAKLASFTRNATDFELVEPVLRIATDGHAERM